MNRRTFLKGVLAGGMSLSAPAVVTTKKGSETDTIWDDLGEGFITFEIADEGIIKDVYGLESMRLCFMHRLQRYMRQQTHQLAEVQWCEYLGRLLWQLYTHRGGIVDIPAQLLRPLNTEDIHLIKDWIINADEREFSRIRYFADSSVGDDWEMGGTRRLGFYNGLQRSRA